MAGSALRGWALDRNCPVTVPSQNVDLKLSDFRRVCVRNRKILPQMKFLRRRRCRFRLSATREDRNAARAQRRLWRLMASKTEETPQKEGMPEKEGPETLPDSLLLREEGEEAREESGEEAESEGGEL